MESRCGAPTQGLSCQELVEQLVDWFGGEADPALVQALERHCALCPDCDHMRCTYGETIRLAERLLARRLAPEQRDALEARVLEALGVPPPQGSRG